VKLATIAGIVFALSAAACARESQPSRAPSLAFAAPIDVPSSPCSVGDPRVVSSDPIITTKRTPEKMIGRPHGSFVVVWIDGTVETGYGVRGLLLSPQGMPIGAPFSISGAKHAALATVDATFVDDERAEVTYYSSTERGFELVSASITCGP
jgi:hypothetical protein